MRERRLTHHEGAGGVDCEDAGEIVFAKLQRGAPFHHARNVAQHIQPVDCSSSDKRAAAVKIRRVIGFDLRGGDHHLGGLFQTGAVHVPNGHPGAFFCKENRSRAANAGRSPCDENLLAFETHLSLPYLAGAAPLIA